MKPKSLSQPEGFPLLAIIIGVGFYGGMVVVAAIFVSIFVPPAFETLRAQSWVPTPCTILNTESSTGSSHVTFRFLYVFNGLTYTAAVHSGDEDLARRCRPGEKTTCFVNPGNPHEAVLSREWKWFMLIGLLPVVILLGTLIKGVQALRMVRQKRRKAFVPLSDQNLSPPPNVPDNRDVSRPLKPLESRGRNFRIFFVFALIWNAVVWPLLVLPALQDLRNFPRCDFCGLLFCSVFGLMGIVVAGAAGYLGLLLLNPRIVITLSSGPLPLGGRSEFTWRFQGRHGRIRKLTITLEGREEATYTRGTDTVTDVNVFYTAVLVEVSDPSAIASGRATAVVPANLVPSFDAENNKIVWCLKVHGEIPRWPDLQDEFVIHVTPLPGEAIEQVQEPQVGGSHG